MDRSANDHLRAKLASVHLRIAGYAQTVLQRVEAADLARRRDPPADRVRDAIGETLPLRGTTAFREWSDSHGAKPVRGRRSVVALVDDDAPGNDHHRARGNSQPGRASLRAGDLRAGPVHRLA